MNFKEIMKEVLQNTTGNHENQFNGKTKQKIQNKNSYSYL